MRSGKLRTAATKFVEASAALKKALRELEQVPGPTQDEARLASWFRYVKVEAELFSAAGKKLKSGNKAAAEHIVVQLTQNANKANLQVLPFGFHYCRLEPAQVHLIWPSICQGRGDDRVRDRPLWGPRPIFTM